MIARASEWILFVSVAGVLYPVVGYPLILLVISKLRSWPVRKASYLPQVTILIPAYNEAECIARTLENKLEQDYPPEMREIVVVSDASDDGTDEIVSRYAQQGVKIIRREVREGKASALNAAVASVTSEIIIFSDANSCFADDTVRKLVENFADPTVGYVTGNLEYTHSGQTTGRGGGLYMRYENWLRTLESNVGSVIGVNGGVDAMRRSLYVPVPKEQITDFVLPLHVMATGSRVVFDESARSMEEANVQMAAEFRMRVRVALRAFNGLRYEKAVLNLIERPLSAFCVVSHKILRYIGFAFLLGTFLANAALASRGWFLRDLFVCQSAFYVLALIGWRAGLPRGIRRVTDIPAYFLMSNVAFAVATFRFLRGDTLATWKPRAG